MWSQLTIVALCTIGWACQHPAQASRGEPRSLWEGQSEQLKTWLTYTSQLEAMNARDLKQEVERQRKLASEGHSDVDELRYALSQSVQHTNSHAYQKASDALQDISGRMSFDPELRLWIRLYSQQLQNSAQLERDLAEERKQKLELEKKMKALSNIEIEMRQREGKGVAR